MIKEINVVKRDLKETLVNIFNSHSDENNNVYIMNVDTGNYLGDLDDFFIEHGKGYVDDNADPVKPVIVRQLLKHNSESKSRSFFYAILDCFWTPYEKTWSDEQLLKQISVLLTYCKVKLLILSGYNRFIENADLPLLEKITERSGASVIAVKSTDGLDDFIPTERPSGLWPFTELLLDEIDSMCVSPQKIEAHTNDGSDVIWCKPKEPIVFDYEYLKITHNSEMYNVEIGGRKDGGESRLWEKLSPVIGAPEYAEEIASYFIYQS